MVKCASTALPPSATAAENLNASCGSRKSAECAACGTGQASHASAAITRRPTRCQGFTDSIFVASPCNSAVKGGLRLTIGAGGGCPAAPGAVVQTYFFISSLDTASFDIASLDIASLDMASLDIPSLDMASLDIASLDIGSFFIASLDIASLGLASCAYTAEPANTRQVVSRAVASLFMDISQNGLRFNGKRAGLPEQPNNRLPPNRLQQRGQVLCERAVLMSAGTRTRRPLAVRAPFAYFGQSLRLPTPLDSSSSEVSPHARPRLGHGSVQWGQSIPARHGRATRSRRCSHRRTRAR